LPVSSPGSAAHHLNAAIPALPQSRQSSAIAALIRLRKVALGAHCRIRFLAARLLISVWKILNHGFITSGLQAEFVGDTPADAKLDSIRSQ
jgi:hypothetical protein